jgi:hypothetical protein
MMHLGGYIEVSVANITCRQRKLEMVMHRRRGRGQVLEGLVVYTKEFVGQQSPVCVLVSLQRGHPHKLLGF